MSQAVVIEAPVASASPEMPDSLYEVVYGQVVEKPMAAKSVWVASQLHGRLHPYSESRGLGMTLSEPLFVLDAERDLKRRPDLAFVSVHRWPPDREIPDEDDAWDVVPELAVEVNSPSNKLADVLAKIREYFEAGVEQVWLIVPSERLIYVYDSPSRVRILTQEDKLDGGEIVPGFRTPVAELFPKVATNPA